MALTTLDRRTAFVLVDLQKGLAGDPFLHPIGKVKHVVPRLCETGTSQEIVDLLARSV